MKVSIVTPTFNSAKYIRHTLESVRQQATDGLEIEHLVVDGGSTDSTLDIVSELGSSIVSSGPDNGMYDAVNKGLSSADCDIVAYINSDDQIARGAVKYVSQIFREHPRTDWVLGTRRYITSKGDPIVSYRPVPFSAVALAGLGWSCIPQETVWIRQTFRARVGLMDESLRTAADYDYFLRCRSFSKPLIAGVHLADFRVHPTQLSGQQNVVRNESAVVSSRYEGDSIKASLAAQELRLRLNLRNPRWFRAKKAGRIDLGT